MEEPSYQENFHPVAIEGLKRTPISQEDLKSLPRYLKCRMFQVAGGTHVVVDMVVIYRKQVNDFPLFFFQYRLRENPKFYLAEDKKNTKTIFSVRCNNDNVNIFTFEYTMLDDLIFTRLQQWREFNDLEVDAIYVGVKHGRKKRRLTNKPKKPPVDANPAVKAKATGSGALKVAQENKKPVYTAASSSGGEKNDSKIRKELNDAAKANLAAVPEVEGEEDDSDDGLSFLNQTTFEPKASSSKAQPSKNTKPIVIDSDSE
jgi:hypothetical protein